MSGYIKIVYQDGPISEVGVNGCQVEDVVQAAIDRLVTLNSAPFACRDNSIAITMLQEAIMWLNERTRAHIVRGVEGTSKP